MMQIGMTGEDIRLSGFQSPKRRIRMKLPTGIPGSGIGGEQLLKADTERCGDTETTDILAVFIQGLQGKIQTGMQTFQKFFKVLFLNVFVYFKFQIPTSFLVIISQDKL